MDLPASRRVPRVPRYLGTRSRARQAFKLQDSHPLRYRFPTISPMLDTSSGDPAESPNRAPQHRTTNAGRLPIARFGLFPFRSPLLRESLLLSLPEGTKMVQFPSFAIAPYGFRHDCQGMTPGGLPHSEILESKCAYHSSRLFAVSHVLLRLHMPRHPPYAATCLTLI